MSSEEIRKESVMAIFRAVLKFIMLFLFLFFFIAFIGKMQDETRENIENTRVAMELIENEEYMLVIDGCIVEKGVFDTTAPDLEFVYRVKKIDDQEKIIYLTTRKII